MGFAKAATFLFEHPEWFWRDCDDCRRWLFEDGEVKRDRDGNPVPNPCPPDCARTPCKSREAKPEFTAYGWRVYERWKLCRDMRCLPEPGSLADQDPWEMRRFRILFDLDAARREKRASGVLQALFARSLF